MEVNTTLTKKRPKQHNELGTVDNTPEDHLNGNGSNIVLSFHEDQTSSIQYMSNSSQALVINNSVISPNTVHQVNGANHSAFHNKTPFDNDQIQIFMNPQEFDVNAVNNLENNSEIKTSAAACSDPFLVDKQPILAKIPNVQHVPKESTTIVPEDEVIYLSESNSSNNCSLKTKTTTRAKKPKKRKLPLQSSEKDRNLRSFDLIYQNSEKIKLPNSTWGYHKNDKDSDIMVFSKVRWFSTNACTLPLYERQVVFHKSSELKIYINNVFSPLETPRPRDISEMEQVLLDVDELSLCSGGPSIEFVPVAALAQKDHAAGRWRHKYCPIIVATDESICKYCASINQVFRYPKQKRLPFGKRPRGHKQSLADDSS